jgi:hypothetical protein
MVQVLGADEWRRFASVFSAHHAVGQPLIPPTAVYRGRLPGDYDYTLSGPLLSSLRDWLYERGESRLLYFLTESSKSMGEDVNFSVDIFELGEEVLQQLNPGVEAVLTGEQFDWAIFVDHEGGVHVGGPPELMERLRQGSDEGRPFG